MATAATSLLGLALPVTGELSGTWGDTVNNSLTSLLDTAVAGTTTLSSDADVTLTTTTLASNQARQAIILWTAGGTATRTITAPAQSKPYIVINKTSSTQSIKIVGAGPTTGVTIAAGTAALVAWNGVDFVTVSVMATTGILPVASGGTGVTTSTGSGNNVLSTSPTLVTPALGTPSALVGTNITGTATGLSIGGNAATATTATNQSGGTVSATSIAYSTTLTGGTGIVNLGSGQFYKDASGNVGIGTSSPGYKLTIAGVGGATAINLLETGVRSWAIRAGGAVTNTFDIADLTAGATRLSIDSSGNLLIGTTTSPAGSKELVLGGDYIEGVVAIGTVTSSSTIALTNGTVQTATLTASTACTFTMPTATAGKSFVLLLKQAASTGNGTATFTGVKWSSAGAPTITATAGKMDILTFIADGTNWYGSIAQGYTP